MRILGSCVVTLLLLVAAATAQDPIAPTAPAPAATTTTRLLYDLPAYDVSRLLEQTKDSSIDGIVADLLARLRLRLGADATVTGLGGTAFAVDVPGDAAAVSRARTQIEAKALEMRAVATDDFAEDEVRFDLAEERARLQRWLAAGGKELVLADPQQIARFHDDPKAGPKAGRHLRWLPHLVGPQVDDPVSWEMPFVLQGGPTNLADSVVAVFDQAADYQGGRIPANRQKEAHPFLLEFVAVNWKERFFDGTALDPEGTVVTKAQDGRPAVEYRMRPENAPAYGDWSQKYLRKHTVLVVFGTVRSAPYFASRIPGRGQISGGCTEAEVEALAASLRLGDLPITPVWMRQEVRPATKGH